MASELVRILRVKRTDSKTQRLLLHIEQASVTRPLDLKLVATEQEHVYHGSIKATQIESLKSDHFSGDEDELRDVLMFCLLQVRPDGTTTEALQGLETVAALQKDSFIITIRKNIGGITQRIASIDLIEDDEREEVQAFEWVDVLAQAVEKREEALEANRSELDAQRDEILSLKSRLDEFIKTKKEHEDDLLQKFAALLNTKKRKIRELRSLLDRAKIDVDETVSDAEPVHTVGRSRTTKRKVARDDDGDHEMVDAASGDDHVDEELENGTPERTDDEDDLDDAPPVRSTRSVSQAHPQHSQSKTTSQAMNDLPPDRELSSVRRSKDKTGSTNGKQALVATNRATDVEDDTEDEL